jgi:carbon starvation protein
MWVLAYSNAFEKLWPIFATANQLLAALGLLAASAWLLLRNKKYAFTLVPAAFMLVTTMASLVVLLPKYWRTGNVPLVVTDVLLMILSLGVVGLFFRTFLGPRSPAMQAEAPSAAASR